MILSISLEREEQRDVPEEFLGSLIADVNPGCGEVILLACYSQKEQSIRWGEVKGKNQHTEWTYTLYRMTIKLALSHNHKGC